MKRPLGRVQTGANGQLLSVVHLDHTSERGGAEFALARILTSPDRGWKATLVLPERTPAGVYSGVEDTGGAIVHAGDPQRPGATEAGLLGGLRVVGGLLQQAFSLRRLRVVRDADVVHANTSRSAVYGALALIGTRIPLVVHLRDRVEPAALGRFGDLAMRKIVLPRASAVIANSRSTSETVASLLREDQRVWVIPSPIGIARRAEPADTDAPAGPVRLGMIARLDPWKGQQEVLEAFLEAGVGHGAATLTFVGDAEFGKDGFATRLQELTTRFGLSSVEFAGFDPDVTTAIDSFDVCIQYSTRPEPLGQNVLQYLARGKAIIAANEGGPTEWITHGEDGLLVAPRDVPSLARSIRELVENPELRQRLSAAAMTSDRLIDDATVVAAHLQAFAAAASKNPSHRVEIPDTRPPDSGDEGPRNPQL
jgi:glycosyltransferase involved in cell wall biosynthesis